MWIWLLDSCHVGQRAVEESSMPRDRHTDSEKEIELGVWKREGEVSRKRAVVSHTYLILLDTLIFLHRAFFPV